MKKLIAGLMFFGSIANAGLCNDQFISCKKDYMHYCDGIKPLDNDEESQTGAKIVYNLCQIGANFTCFQEVNRNLGPDVCKKEVEESNKEASPAPSPKAKYEAKEKSE
jgi:hypothetical protein